MNKKRWIIPDIHGCSKTLQSLIENQIKARKWDELIFLGDYIDRGPDSKGVIDYLMELQQHEYNLRFLKGNHEEYCIKTWEADKAKRSFLGLKFRSKGQKVWEQHGGTETLKSFGVDLAGQIPEPYINWMQKLEMYIETEQYIIVHAGLNFKNDDPFSDTSAMLWTKEFTVEPHKIRNKKVIHGHTPVELEFIDYVIRSSSYHFIDLDNGVYIQNRAGYGNLIGFELDSKEYVVQPNIDL